MTKSQIKMQNLTLKIQKLARVLNKFTISDIQQLIPENIETIEKIIKKLVLENIIKQLSETEFLYSKIKTAKIKDLQNKEIIETTDSNIDYSKNEWLTMDEVAELTEEKRETVRRKCKNGTYISTYKKVGRFKEYLIKKSSIKKYIKPKHRYHKIEFTNSQCPRINQDNFKFKDLNEQKIYNNAYDFQKKRIKKYITLFKLAGKLAGKELQEYLKKVSMENPELKTSYPSFLKAKWKYNKEGISALIPQYGKSNRGKSIVSQDMYENFKKIYLSSTEYSLKTAVEELSKFGYPPEVLPSFKSFERLLKKEYSNEYIKAQRETSNYVSNIRFDEEYQLTPKTQKPLFDNYIDAANAYLEEYATSNTDTQICRRGYIKNHLTPYFKNFKFCEITNSTIEDFVKIKMSEGYALASINRFMSALSSIMNEYNIPKHHLMTSSSNLPIMDKQCKVLDDDEINQIIKNKDERLWILCLGITPVELEALEYSDVDFKNGTIKIDKCIFNNRIEKYKKLYKIRTLKISKIIFKTLSKAKTGKIFNKVNIINYDILLNTHVKLLLDKNVQINIISKNLGFQKITDFEKRFQGLLPQDLKDDFEIL